MTDNTHLSSKNEVLFVPDEPIEINNQFNISKLFQKENQQEKIATQEDKKEKSPVSHQVDISEQHLLEEKNLESPNPVVSEDVNLNKNKYLQTDSDKDLLEEKKRKVLNDAQLDYKNTERMKQLESQPAWVRRNIILEDSINTNPKLSKLSVDVDQDGKGKLRDNNSFLFDAVDLIIMKLHKEAYPTAIYAIAPVAIIIIISFLYLPFALFLPIGALGFVFILLVFNFFRNPDVHVEENIEHILAPCDGKVVVIEEVFEPLLFQKIHETNFYIHVSFERTCK